MMPLPPYMCTQTKNTRPTKSKLDTSTLNPFQISLCKAGIGAIFQPEQKVAFLLYYLWINTVLLQQVLLLLVCACKLHFLHGADPDGDSEARQLFLDVIGEGLEDVICGHRARLVSEDDCSAAGAAVVARDLDAVDVCFGDGGVFSEDLADFGRGDVFGFPAKRVAEAVDEPDTALGVPAHEVARAEVCVALFLDVADDFAVCGFGVAVVAREALVDVVGLELREELAGLVVLAYFAQACLGVAGWRRGIRLRVHANEAELLRQDGVCECAEVANCARGKRVCRAVEERAGGFGCGVELVDGFDAEALLEGLPDVRAQAVAKGGAQLVLLVQGGRRSRQEIATCFADVV